MKAKIVRDSEGLFYGIRFMCPGCLWPDTGKPQAVILPVSWLPPGETKESPHVANQPHWSFNGDFEKPVFGPSVLGEWNEWTGARVSTTKGDGPTKRCCHSFIGCNGAQPGQIKFLADSTHALAGQTVDLPEIEP